MLGILALQLVKDHQKTKDQLKSFDETIMNYTYTIQEHLLGIAVCSLIMLKDYPQSLTNVDIFGQGNLNLVSEKSGKSQGILLSIICGNPEKGYYCCASSHLFLVIFFSFTQLICINPLHVSQHYLFTHLFLGKYSLKAGYSDEKQHSS